VLFFLVWKDFILTGNLRRLYRLVVSDDNDGMRIDQFLAAGIDDLSRSHARKILDLGGVHISGRRSRRCSYTVRAGDAIEVHLDGLPLEPFVLSESHLLYRDSYLLAIDKPPRVDTQPTHARYKGTLYEAIKNFLHDPKRPRLDPELGMAQRLDRDTSGVLVFSIHRRAHKGLTLAVREREVKKVYLALVHGVPSGQDGTIRSMLARSRRDNLVRSVPKGGKDAITHFRVLQTWPAADCALLAVTIPTGRSHQIRAHLTEHGHPLVGDVRYGGSSLLSGREVSRQMLHSWRLQIVHPVEATLLSLLAPLHPDMTSLVNFLDEESFGDIRTMQRLEMDDTHVDLS
jgi:23S rRNA pseudouridine1911/1915/1917 synthase